MPTPYPFSLDFAYAYGQPLVSACLRSKLQDFCVDELLGFEPSGTGEHVYLHICKRGENTQWLAQRLAHLARVKPVDVGFCGLKDRWAETRQWFSVYLPHQQVPDWHSLASSGEANIDILAISRHSYKLRRGMHSGNRFCLRLRQLSDTDTINERCQQIAKHGVPNYFGEQRFGIELNNLHAAQQWLVEKQKIRSRSQRSIVMSAARAYLFNRILSARVQEGSWNSAIDGDVLDHGVPTGAMWGRGSTPVTGKALNMQTAALADWSLWCDGLEHAGLKQERRSLVLRPQYFSWDLSDSDLSLNFDLGVSSYATSVVREIAQT